MCLGGGDLLICGPTTEQIFVGAEREIQEALMQMNEAQITDDLSQHGIQWHFNSPAAPHFGGVWER